MLQEAEHLWRQALDAYAPGNAASMLEAQRLLSGVELALAPKALVNGNSKPSVSTTSSALQPHGAAKHAPPTPPAQVSHRLTAFTAAKRVACSFQALVCCRCRAWERHDF